MRQREREETVSTFSLTVDAIERGSPFREDVFARDGITASKIEAGTANDSGQLHERYAEAVTEQRGRHRRLKTAARIWMAKFLEDQNLCYMSQALSMLVSFSRAVEHIQSLSHGEGYTMTRARKLFEEHRLGPTSYLQYLVKVAHA